MLRKFQSVCFLAAPVCPGPNRPHPQSGREAEHRLYTTHMCSLMVLLSSRGWCCALRQGREPQSHSNGCKQSWAVPLVFWFHAGTQAAPAPLWCHLVTLGRGSALPAPASISFCASQNRKPREENTPIPLGRELCPHTASSMFAHTCIRIYYCHALLEGQWWLSVDHKRMELPQKITLNSFLGVLKIFLRGKKKFFPI